MKNLLPVLIVIMLSACSTAETGKTDASRGQELSSLPEENKDISPTGQKEICLLDSAVQDTLKFVENSIDRNSTEGEPVTTLKKKACSKQEYVRRGFRILIYKKPFDPADRVQARYENTKSGANGSAECLARAENDLKGFDLPAAKHVLEKGRAILGTQWDDADIGSLYWLDCADASSFAYYDSLATLIHETSHALRAETCLYLASQDVELCLDLPNSLPSGAVASFAKFPFKSELDVEAFTQIQNTYMFQMAPPILLFDEFNAYINTTAVYSSLLKKKGKSSLFNKDGSRPAIVQTAFMSYAVRYLAELKKNHAVHYEKHFGASTSNRKNLTSLFNESDKVYSEWLRQLKKVDGKPKDPELWFYKQYLDTRKSLAW